MAGQWQMGFQQSDWLVRDALCKDNETTSTDCFVCSKHALGDAAVGGVLIEDELSYAGK